MCSSEASFSLSLYSNSRVLCQRRLKSCFPANPFFIKPRNSSSFYVAASIAPKNSTREFSWISWDRVGFNEYNGWEVEESAQKPVIKKSKRLSRFVAVGIGASAVGLLAYFCVSSYGFRITSPFRILHAFKLAFLTSTVDTTNEDVSSDEKMGDADIAEDQVGRASDSFTEIAPVSIKDRKLDRILVPFTVDSVQQEALGALKILKIIEDDARADELCTRREYARWLVRANSQLERSRKHQVIPSAALSGSMSIAFDDVSIQDPDFEYIQSLAETGIVRSKLPGGSYSSNLNSNVESEACDSFFPERFITRQDLVSWKAKTEYKVMPGISQEMSRKNIGFLDVKAISSDLLSDIFVDFLANEKSILRGVFGQYRRLQPNKPCTKGQAAVALTCGRLSEFIRAEISRLELENITRQREMKEAMSELLERGEIKDLWVRKMEEERSRGMEVEQDYHTSVTDLEQEKTFHENSLAELLKQQAALDCQKQLLSTLNSEVVEMSERFDSERVKLTDEQINVKKTRHDLEMNYEALLDTKSVLEAELEALRILRSWVENEARKSQGRAKVLEEAGRRWKWDN
ncbi:uncharacterized protein [Primulina huaijiensis]|uniref:uncharacterized protein isoform X3 n=1 Tax=Primulina huaijiensis TaxID=1492673 RepID=UPI003CC76658